MSNPNDEDEDEPERWCIQCGGYCWPDELEWLICQECRENEWNGE